MKDPGQRLWPLVLYVDDNDDDLFLLGHAAALSNIRFELRTAAGVEAAKDYLTNPAERVPAMIIIDYVMRNSRGTDLIRWLHDRPVSMAIPVLMMSGRDDATCVAHSYAIGADSFLQKAQTQDGLQEIVHAVAKCVTAAVVSVEPLKNLPGYRTCRILELREALKQDVGINAVLREELSKLRVELDTARAEAKEDKRKFPYPGRPDPPDTLGANARDLHTGKDHE